VAKGADMTWQPIETATKDGNQVLTYWGGSKHRNPVIVINEYNPRPREIGSCDWWHSLPNELPTHWMPLPPPPQAAVDIEGAAV
jgi:hypothetical protein